MNRLHSTAWRIVAAAALLAAPLPFGTSADKLYRNPNFKFSLYVFNDWNEVPVAVGEELEVAKFYEPGSKGDAFRPELTVYRVNRRPEDEEPGKAPATGEPEKLPKELRRELERLKKRSLYEIAFGQLMFFDGKKWPEDKNFKEVTSKDHVKGKFWSIEIPFGPKATPDNTLLALLFTYEKDGVEYGARLTCSARRKDSYEPLMKGIAKSFLFFDDKAKDAAKLTVLDDINLPPERKAEIEKGLIKGWDVIVSPKKNYVVVYNTKGDANRELARILADRIEKIRAQVYEKQFPPSHPVTAVSVMRVCGDAAEYHAYGGPGGSAGYWNDHTEELVFYDASHSNKVDDNTLSVLYHEAFHQYIYYSVGSVAPHSWFNEGHGDYYAGAKYGTSKFVIHPFAWRVGVLKTALNQGPRKFTVEKDDKGVEHKKWGNTGYTPLKDLVGFSQQEYYAYPSVSYAQGWSLIYFLREEVPKKKEWNAKWGKILPTYFDALKGEVARVEAEKARRRQHGGEGHPTKPPAGPTGEPGEPDPKKPPAEPAPPSPPDAPPSGPPGEPSPAPPVPPGGPPAEPPTGPPPSPPSEPPAGPTEPKAPDEPKEPKEPKPGDEGEPPVDPGFQPMQSGEVTESALQLALRQAFEGVNFDELEAAWKETMKHVKQ
jgi:hypothetical protein